MGVGEVMPGPEVRSQDGSNLIMSRVSIKKDQLRLLIHFRLPPDFFDISKGTDEISPSHGSATSRRS